MLVQCTKKLLDKLNIKPEQQQEEDDLFSWHANIITVFRKKAVILLNDKNQYVIILYGLTAKHFKMMDKHIIEAIKETFREACINEEIIEKFINHSKGIIYTKTKSRLMIAKMNRVCEILYCFNELLKGSSVYKTSLSLKASQYLLGEKYSHPNEEMYKDLEVFAKDNIFNCKAVEIKITLDLEKHEVWRKIVIPVNYTFAKLHKIIQIAFDWQDYHLHKYYIYDESSSDMFSSNPGYHKEGYKPIIMLECDEEAFDYPNDFIEMKLEVGVKLSEYIPAKIKYVYDFGDNWEHYIDVEKIIDNYDKNYPVCLDGKGNAPPEDAGAEYGYEKFLEIIGDKNNPEYEDMLAWGTSQGYEDFDVDKINKKIKKMYVWD